MLLNLLADGGVRRGRTKCAILPHAAGRDAAACIAGVIKTYNFSLTI
jgi:hypothetical protein